ncbi:MAG TPA: hypothetical protein VJ654_14210 [Noviherbaspirillum sp.]|nr:hypothetical protein [Noviherbaspirillum sp.]
MAYTRYKDIAPFGLRLQPKLKEKLEEAAQGKPKWSLNAEISKRLEESFEARSNLTQYSDGELIDELIRRWGRDRVYIKLGDEKP